MQPRRSRAAADAAAKTAAQAKLDEVNADAGWIFKKGRDRLRRRHRGAHQRRHRRSGRRGLLIGKRTGYGKDLMAPHSLTMTMIGASLLWVGWFGFNAGSNLEANGGAALAMTNSFVANRSGGAGLDVRGMDRQGSPLRTRRVCRARWLAWSRSRPRPVTPVRWARSCSVSWSAVVCLFFCHRGEECAWL